MNIVEEILFLLVFIYTYIKHFNYKNTIKIKNGKYNIKIPDFIDQKSNISQYKNILFCRFQLQGFEDNIF